jgi:hypothetical protein
MKVSSPAAIFSRSKLMQGRFSRGRSGGQSALASPGALRYASVMGIISSLLLLASAQAAAEPLPAEIHNFGDWVVTCDNGLRCEAVSLAPDKVPTLVGEEPAANQEDLNSWDVFGVMRMEREPAAAAPLVITVSDFEGVPAKLLQYGEALDVRFERAGEDEWRVVPRDQKDFLDRFFRDPMVLQDAAGKTWPGSRLRGASGALIYMDERQGPAAHRHFAVRPGTRRCPSSRRRRRCRSRRVPRDGRARPRHPRARLPRSAARSAAWPATWAARMLRKPRRARQWPDPGPDVLRRRAPIITIPSHSSPGGRAGHPH